MITMKDLGLIVVANVFIVISFLIMPYGEQYQGASGYIYPNGWLYAIGYIVLLIASIMIFVYVIVDNYEAPT